MSDKDGIQLLMMQNLKLIKILKSSGKTDREIAEALGLKITEFTRVLSEDNYIKEVYEKAQEKVLSDIESKFVQTMLAKLEANDTADAKWYLEKTSNKFAKKEQLTVTTKTIDDIVREKNNESKTETDPADKQ